MIAYIFENKKNKLMFVKIIDNEQACFFTSYPMFTLGKQQQFSQNKTPFYIYFMICLWGGKNEFYLIPSGVGVALLLAY